MNPTEGSITNAREDFTSQPMDDSKSYVLFGHRDAPEIPLDNSATMSDVFVFNGTVSDTDDDPGELILDPIFEDAYMVQLQASASGNSLLDAGDSTPPTALESELQTEVEMPFVAYLTATIDFI